jgi:hypothetical protein
MARPLVVGPVDPCEGREFDSLEILERWLWEPSTLHDTRRTGHSQLTDGRNTWLYKLPWLPPILVPPPEAQITPFTNADP